MQHSLESKGFTKKKQWTNADPNETSFHEYVKINVQIVPEMR